MLDELDEANETPAEEQGATETPAEEQCANEAPAEEQRAPESPEKPSKWPSNCDVMMPNTLSPKQVGKSRR